MSKVRGSFQPQSALAVTNRPKTPLDRHRSKDVDARPGHDETIGSSVPRLAQFLVSTSTGVKVRSGRV